MHEICSASETSSSRKKIMPTIMRTRHMKIYENATLLPRVPVPQRSSFQVQPKCRLHRLQIRSISRPCHLHITHSNTHEYNVNMKAMCLFVRISKYFLRQCCGTLFLGSCYSVFILTKRGSGATKNFAIYLAFLEASYK